MPAFFDTGEFGANSTMPAQDKFDNLVLVPGLSKRTGCDALLSTWAAKPRTAKLVTKHLERGALLVEIKRMDDLPGSLLNHRTNHLQKQTVRMIATGAQPVQRVLLYTGVHLPTPAGNLRIGEFDGNKVSWRHTEYNYQHFQRAKSKLQDSGLLRWEGLASNQEIPIWVADKLRHLKEYQTNPVKILRRVQMPLKRETLRQMEEREGAEILLALFDNIGAVTAARIMKYCGNRMCHAIEFLTNPGSAGRIPRMSKKAIPSFRAQLGLTRRDFDASGDPVIGDWDSFAMYTLPLGTQECTKENHNLAYWDKECPLCRLEKSQLEKAKE